VVILGNYPESSLRVRISAPTANWLYLLLYSQHRSELQQTASKEIGAVCQRLDYEYLCGAPGPPDCNNAVANAITKSCQAHNMEAFPSDAISNANRHLKKQRGRANSSAS
jgi:hypothetical protein